MPKPKADDWLREAFRDGIDDRHVLSYHRDPKIAATARAPRRAYPTAHPDCWLAHHDPKKRPCNFGPRGVFERFHFLPRQRVENAMWSTVPGHMKTTAEVPIDVDWDPTDIILLAAWDPRNGELGCEHHHRRYDGHADSPSAPKIIVPAFALPQHFDEYVADYGLEQQAEDRFASYSDPDRAYLWPGQ